LHASEEIAFRKIRTVKNATEQRNLDTLAYKIKCKWEKPGEESRTEVGRRARMRLCVVLKGYK